MTPRRVHFIGIGGVGMAALAVLRKAAGDDVSGCDLKATPRTRWLETQGIRFFAGHDSGHVENIDEIVATPAVSASNSELAAASAAGIPVLSRGQNLARIVSSRESIAVCGSHGKTTTATFIAKLLRALGKKTSWAIGGETGDFPVACDDGGVLVVEADESDGTLALYHPTLLVVTNCEYDHPDHFRTKEEYFACFDEARKNAGSIVEGDGPLHSEDVLGSLECLRELPPHNRRNALVAAEVALRRGHSAGSIAASLPEVVKALPDRRFELVAPGVYTDYAHHPTEMKCAVAMARKVCDGKLRVLFQPHRYSRTKALLDDFPSAFKDADETILCPTYAAFERPVEGGDVADLYAACREAGVTGLHLARSCEEAWEHVANSAVRGDVALLLGAGDIVGLVPLVRSGVRGKMRHEWIGHGTNTWMSDLNLSVAYVKSLSRAGEPGATLGIPWMAGIPGTIGGWVKMNAGAFGRSVSEVLKRVKVDGLWRDAKDCGFGYRTSAIEGEIQDVELLDGLDFSCGPSAIDYLSRRKKFPPGTKGSVFKNPPGDFAGRLLEAAGAKGLKVGGAYVWEEHANVIVSGPGATSGDFLALARQMRHKVFFRYGILLEPEVEGLLF